MSAFLSYNINISSVGPTIWPGFNNNLEDLQEPAYRATEPYTAVGRLQDVDILWQRSSFPGQTSQSIIDGFHQYWEWCWPSTGCHVPKVVSGVVRDCAGVPQAGATVQLFNTATGLLVDTQTSAADGAYQCGDPNAVACFAVGYLPDTPDTAGTTLNTIIGI